MLTQPASLQQMERAEKLKGLGDQIAELWDRLKVRWWDIRTAGTTGD